MAIDQIIRANVYDISRDRPTSDDHFWVDTNVWLWMTYPPVSQLITPNMAQPYQIQKYPPYLKRVMDQHGHLYFCCLSMSELAGLIETTERDVRFGPDYHKKIFRNDPTERALVLDQIDLSWSQVEAMAKSIPAMIDLDFLKIARDRISNSAVDGYDAFFLAAIEESGHVNVISDDGDFATAEGIELFTANSRVLKAARDQDKLHRR